MQGGEAAAKGMDNARAASIRYIVPDTQRASVIERISWLSVSDGGLEPYLSSNSPVVIDQIDLSFAPVHWSIDALRAKFGAVTIRVLRSDSQFFTYNDKRERDIVQMTLADFIEKGIEKPGADGYFYALGRSPIDQFCELKSEMELPRALSSVVDGFLRRPERNLWISPKGTRTALHFDAVENLNLQIAGSKSFLLIPPRIKGMHCYPVTSQAAYVSSVDPRSRDLPVGFPIHKGVEVTLVAGEMLYLPYGWWHQVDTVGTGNVNANYWWFPRVKLASMPAQTLRGLMVLINRMGMHPHKRAQKLA